jgi:Flp pilus assembly protein TadG
MRRAPSRREPRDDRGAVTLFVAVFTVALLAAVGLVVDGGGKVRALQRADEAAREAARAGSQMLDVPSAVRGNGVRVDPAAAARAARAYLDAAGVEGTVTVRGNTVQVSTTLTYRPVFLSVAGVGPLTVTGSATARPVDGDDGGDEEEVP